MTWRASKGKYQSTPSGTTTNSGKVALKSAAGAVEDRLERLLGSRFPLGAGELFERQLAVGIILAHFAEEVGDAPREPAVDLMRQ